MITFYQFEVLPVHFVPLNFCGEVLMFVCVVKYTYLCYYGVTL